ncbi:MAG: hypothetical protein P1V20_22195 [Verrucomicrobiales bacterium]|nr:hypothetical protein [Verrucomicrobiales bacterium]
MRFIRINMSETTSESKTRENLRRYPAAIMNQWFHLGEVRWMTRLEGFSMYAETEFGAFLPSTDSWLEDSSVGLKVRANAVTDCRMLGVPDDGEIQFCLSLQSNADILVSQGDSGNDICPILRRLEKIYGLDGSPGATPWMDEWAGRPDACRNCPFACYEVLERIAKWERIELEVNTEDLSIDISIQPTCADRDGNVLRIFDSRKRLAIYIDLTLPTLSLSGLDHKVGGIRLATSLN